MDASGKLDRKQRQDMAVVFADGKQASLLIPQAVKDRALEACARHKRGKRLAEVKAFLFALLVYLLLREHITTLAIVTIDREYPGHEHLIREHILNLFRRRGVYVQKERIRVGEVEPGSAADKLAWQVSHHLAPPERVVTLGEIVAEF